jgi:hypothetical protein
MVRWSDAVKALLKIVPATPAMIDACRRTLDRSNARHAERGDYWAWYDLYYSLMKALLMTFDLKTTDHTKYYGFAAEIAPIFRGRWSDQTKETAISEVGELWAREGAQIPVLKSVARWAVVTHLLKDPNIEPDPRPKVAAVPQTSAGGR